MTILTKAVRREVPIEIRRNDARQIILTVYPNSTLGFREKGRRIEYVLDLKSAYHIPPRNALYATNT